MKIGVLLIATNKYIRFVQEMADSLRSYFLPAEEVTLYLFSDRSVPRSDLVVLPIKHEPWPLITLQRYHFFHRYREALRQQDYLFYLDVDMRVVVPIGKQILPEPPFELVAVQHPGFYPPEKRGTYETRPASTAFVNDQEGEYYFAGGFNGGTAQAFLEMAGKLSRNTDQDREKGIIAIWHDESHLNRYFIDHPPKVLSPAYCYPESWNLPFPRYIVALDKDHQAFRT